LIKYIKSVLWRVGKRLSYTEDARCLKVKELCPMANKTMDGQNRAMTGGLIAHVRIHDLALATTDHKTPVVGTVTVAL